MQLQLAVAGAQREVVGCWPTPTTYQHSSETPALAPHLLQIRPPVEHQWGCGQQLVHAPAPAPVSVFRHRLLQLFQLSVFCKLPIRPMTTMHDLRCAGAGHASRAGMAQVLAEGWAARHNPHALCAACCCKPRPQTSS